MPASPKIHFNQDAYAWLMALTTPKQLSANSTLGEFVEAETKRNMRQAIQYMQEKA